MSLPSSSLPPLRLKVIQGRESRGADMAEIRGLPAEHPASKALSALARVSRRHKPLYQTFFPVGTRGGGEIVEAASAK